MTPPEIFAESPGALLGQEPHPNPIEGARSPLWALLRACHPMPTAAVTIGASILAATAGADAGRTLLIGIAVLTGQLSVGWSNDWFDAARDRGVGRADKPIVARGLTARTVAASALVAAAATTGFSLLLGWTPGVLHLIAVGSAWLYNWPLKATPVSVLPYLVSFGLLPAFVTTAAGHSTPPGWLVVAGSLLGGGAHFANVLPDFAHDDQTGVRGLPHRLGAAGSRAATVFLLLAAGGLITLGPAGPASWIGVAVLATSTIALIGAAFARRRLGEGLLFRVVAAVALADVALLLTAPTPG